MDDERLNLLLLSLTVSARGAHIDPQVLDASTGFLKLLGRAQQDLLFVRPSRKQSQVCISFQGCSCQFVCSS